MSYWENCIHGIVSINCPLCAAIKSRNLAIEECAQALDELAKRNTTYIGISSLAHAAATIRALKDKP